MVNLRVGWVRNFYIFRWVGEVISLFGGWVWILFRGFFWSNLVVTQYLLLERSLGRLKARKGKALLKLFIYHYLFVKVGVLHLLCLDFYACFMLTCYGVVIWMLVCMLGMLGRIENHVLECFSFMFMFEIWIFLVWVFWYYLPLDRAEVTNFGKVFLVGLQQV